MANLHSRAVSAATPPRQHGPPPPGTETLQLWVEHGLTVSASSAILISRWHAHRTAAATARMADPPPLPHRRTPASAASPTALRPARIVLRRDHAARAALRAQRARLRAAVAADERARADALRRKEDDDRRQRELELERERERVEAQRVAAERRAAEEAAAVARATSAKDATSDAAGHQADKPPPQPQNAQSNAATQGPSAATGNPRSSPAAQKQAKPAAAPTQAQKEILRVKSVFNEVSQEADVFRQDFSAKKMRMQVKKQINLTVNQIAASIKQVTLKVGNLVTLMGHATSSGISGAEAFVMREMATRLIAEGDNTVSLSRAAAFAVGNVIVGVTASARDPQRLRDVFLGAFYEHSIYTMAAYGKKRPTESPDEYRTRIGYKEGETALSYLERMSGSVSLFGAVVQIEQPLTANQGAVQNPFSLDLGWTWLARIVNKDQRSITPSLVCAFLESAGYGMAKRYRRQFAKLMAIVQSAVVLKAIKSAQKGAVSRLDTFINDFINAGCMIPEPPCILPNTDSEFL